MAGLSTRLSIQQKSEVFSKVLDIILTQEKQDTVS